VKSHKLNKMKAAKTYSIININDLSEIDFNQVFQTSANTVKKSLDETKFVIKYNTTPSFIEDGTVEPVEVLSYSQCLELMETSHWAVLDNTKK
jgi:hypothetical protein